MVDSSPNIKGYRNPNLLGKKSSKNLNYERKYIEINTSYDKNRQSLNDSKRHKLGRPVIKGVRGSKVAQVENSDSRERPIPVNKYYGKASLVYFIERKYKHNIKRSGFKS